MKNVGIFILMVIILISIKGASAQGEVYNGSPSNPVPAWVRIVEEKREEERIKREKLNNDASTQYSRPRNSQIIKNSAADLENLRDLEENLTKFAVPSQYRRQYADFLKSRNTGIAKMFPDINCGGGKTVEVGELERCAGRPQIEGGGSLYSTRLYNIPITNQSAASIINTVRNYLSLSDLRYTGEKLVVGNSSVLNIITEVKDSKFENISLGSVPVAFLRDFKPAASVREFEVQRRQIKQGVVANGYFYSDAVAPVQDATYILRSVAYRQQSSPKTFWHTDIITVMKIVGVESDGSIVFIWRNLKVKDAALLKK